MHSSLRRQYCFIMHRGGSSDRAQTDRISTKGKHTKHLVRWKEATEKMSDVRDEEHKKLAIHLFNLTWDFIEKADRSEVDNEIMIHAAHASRFHWSAIGKPLNFARGEWQISRVYAIVGRPEPALYHARRSLEICLVNHLGDFDLGFSYEALARAYGVMGDPVRRDEYISCARKSAALVAKESDKLWLLNNIDTVESLSLPKWSGT